MKTNTVNKFRAAHHRALETLRDESCELSGIQLWRKLRTLESITHSIAEASCNGESIRVTWPLFGIREYDFHSNEDAWEDACNVATDCVRNVFGCVPEGFFVNGDARGCALKLDGESVTAPKGMETDWGRNGILAAEIQ